VSYRAHSPRRDERPANVSAAAGACAIGVDNKESFCGVQRVQVEKSPL